MKASSEYMQSTQTCSMHTDYTDMQCAHRPHKHAVCTQTTQTCSVHTDMQCAHRHVVCIQTCSVYTDHTDMQCHAAEVFLPTGFFRCVALTPDQSGSHLSPKVGSPASSLSVSQCLTANSSQGRSPNSGSAHSTGENHYILAWASQPCSN